MSTFTLTPVQGSHSTMSAKGKTATSLERQLLADIVAKVFLG
jgi:hypothetical protein